MTKQSTRISFAALALLVLGASLFLIGCSRVPSKPFGEVNLVLLPSGEIVHFISFSDASMPARLQADGTLLIMRWEKSGYWVVTATKNDKWQYTVNGNRQLFKKTPGGFEVYLLGPEVIWKDKQKMIEEYLASIRFGK